MWKWGGLTIYDYTVMRMPDWNMKDSFSVGVNTDKFHIRLVGERLPVEVPLCGKAVKLFICLRRNTAVSGYPLFMIRLRQALYYRRYLLFVWHTVSLRSLFFFSLRFRHGRRR